MFKNKKINKKCYNAFNVVNFNILSGISFKPLLLRNLLYEFIYIVLKNKY